MNKFEHAVVGTLISNDGRYLFVQETKPEKEHLYNFPAGHIEPLESTLEAAIRETKEETGFDIEITGMVGVYQSVYPHINIAGVIFCGKIVGGKLTITAEHPTIEWFSRLEVEKMTANGQIFTNHPMRAVRDFESRGAFPVSSFSAQKFI